MGFIKHLAPVCVIKTSKLDARLMFSYFCKIGMFQYTTWPHFQVIGSVLIYQKEITKFEFPYLSVIPFFCWGQGKCILLHYLFS